MTSFFNIKIGIFFILVSTVFLNAQVVITPSEYPNALRNPAKGLRWGFKNQEWSANFPNHPYVSCGKWYIGWNYLENNESDDISKIREYCDTLWKNIPNTNNKVIPRVYLYWGTGDNHWPADMATGDWNSSQFKTRVARLIKRLGEVWDNDPRIAYVEMGIYGQWGELHTPYLNDTMQQIMGDGFINAFKNKKVMAHHRENYDIVYFDKYTNFPFGIYWDSFAHPKEEFFANDIDSLNDFWKTKVIGGETAYNWGGIEEYIGNNPTETMSTKAYYNRVINYIRRCHTNHVGWVAEYDVNNPSTSTGADFIQKALGYRFVIDSVIYPKKIITNENFDVSFIVTNTGSSPFYYKWPVEISLLDSTTKEVVWKDVFPNTDIRTWNPGDDWNYSNPAVLGSGYNISPLPKKETGTFNIPSTVPSGTYIVALSILDPSGMLPSIRFATSNYLNGGRHPMGYVGVDKNISNYKLTNINFDDPQQDKSLHYIYPTPNNILITYPRGKENWVSKTSETIKWESYGSIKNINIDLSTDGGLNWTPLITNASNNDSIQINVPNIQSTKCRIRVLSTNGFVVDTSNANFTICNQTNINAKPQKNLENNIQIQNFNSTQIGYSIAQTSNIKVSVYNSLGKKITTLVNKKEDPGIYKTIFDTRKLSNGIYYYQMQSDNFTLIKRVVLFK